MAEDEDLVRRIGHEPEALAELYRRHVRALLGYAGRRLGNPTDAADLVAAVFLEVIRTAGRYDPARGTPRAWLFGIAATLIAAQGRSRGREARALQRVYGQRELLPEDHAELAGRIDAARHAEALHGAVDRLAPGERELFLLVALDGLTPTEAAEVLGIAPATARMRLSRARRKLRAALPEPLLTQVCAP